MLTLIPFIKFTLIILPLAYNVEKVINEIQDTLRREAEMEHSEGWNAILFPSPAVKRMLFVGLGTAFAQQIVGIDAIQYFLLNIIEEAGIEDKTTQIVILINLGILKLTILVWAGKQFDKRGRRQMFFISLSGEDLIWSISTLTSTCSFYIMN